MDHKTAKHGCHARPPHTHRTPESGMFRPFHTRTHWPGECGSGGVESLLRVRYCWERPSSRLGRSRPCSDFLLSFLTFRLSAWRRPRNWIWQSRYCGGRDPCSGLRPQMSGLKLRVDSCSGFIGEWRQTNVLWRDGTVRVSSAVSCGTPAAHMHRHRCCSAEKLTDMKEEWG